MKICLFHVLFQLLLIFHELTDCSISVSLMLWLSRRMWPAVTPGLIPVKAHPLPSSFWLTAVISLLFSLSVLEEVQPVAVVFVLQPDSLRPQTCPAPTMNPPLLMRPWTVFGRYGLFVYSALHQYLCCVFASVSVMRVKHTDATLCFMSESARKTTTASFLHWAGFSEGFHHLLRSIKVSLFVGFGGFSVLKLSFCCVRSCILNWGRSQPHTRLIDDLSA